MRTARRDRGIVSAAANFDDVIHALPPVKLASFFVPFRVRFVVDGFGRAERLRALQLLVAARGDDGAQARRLLQTAKRISKPLRFLAAGPFRRARRGACSNSACQAVTAAHGKAAASSSVR